MVIRYFVAHPELLNELFLIMGRKELRFMQNFGFYFGYPMGFVLVALLQVAAVLVGAPASAASSSAGWSTTSASR